MKKILLIAFLFLLNSTHIFAQWEELRNINIGSNITCLAVSENIIYAGTEKGLFISEDNGDNWKELITQDTIDMRVLSVAVKGDTIIIGTRSLGLFISFDNGSKWKNLHNMFDITIDIPINAIVFDNSGSIYVGSENYEISSSSNYGDSWDHKFYEKGYEVTAFICIGNNIIAGTNLGILFSKNGSSLDFYSRKRLDSIGISSFAKNENNVFAGTDNGLYLAEDSGDNWTRVNIDFSDNIQSMVLVNNNIFAISRSKGLFQSIDFGENWKLVNQNLVSYISFGSVRKWSIVIGYEYIFVSADSRIFRAKLSDFGITNVQEKINEFNISLFPNPANNTFRLKYNSDVEKQAQLSIYDYLGKEVLSLSEPCVAGANEKTVDCSRLSTGYYIVKVRCGAGVQTQGLVILK
ncbi:MAG: T9SS type A sorting domain-containing protein [Bacteroidota bacterium]|jgi:photosystem II stability/assembly factor-like uncharacterized protein